MPSSSAYVYNARIHPEQNGSGGVVVSYNVNSLDPQDAYRDVDLYRPKFVNVSLNPVEDRAALPGAPTNLTVTELAPGKIRLSWTPPAGSNLKYWVYERNEAQHASWFTRSQNPTTATSVEIGFLDSGAYELRVSAENSVGEGPKSASAWATVSIPPPATAPTGLEATANADGSVSLEWDAVTMAGWPNYHVEQRDVTEGDTEFSRSGSATVSGTTARVTNLTHGNVHAFRIIAGNSGGEGPPSSEVQVTVRIAAPPAPTNLTATSRADGTIGLSWTGPSPDRWYWVYTRNVSTGGSWQRSEYPITSGTSTVAGFLTNGQTYAFYVTTIGADGAPDSGPSNTVQATPRMPVPPAPTSLTATELDNGDIRLNWGSSGSGIWYWVYSRDVTAGESFKRSKYPVSSGTSFTAGYLTLKHTYAFYVTAFNDGGESAKSNTREATSSIPLPPAPGGLTTTKLNNGDIRLNWNSVGSGIWYYVYSRDVTAGESFKRSKYPVSSGTSLTAGYLKTNHTYAFQVRALNAMGEGAASSTVQAVSTIPAPTNLTGAWTSVGATYTVRISWNSVNSNGWFYVWSRDVTTGGSWIRNALPVSGRMWQDIKPLQRHAYEFKVTQAGNGGESAFSNTVAMARPANPYAYTRADIVCEEWWVKPPRLPKQGWVEVHHKSWGVAEEAGKIYLRHEIYKNGQWYATHTSPITTAYDGAWSYTPPEHVVPPDGATWLLRVTVEGPNGENWAQASATCSA